MLRVQKARRPESPKPVKSPLIGRFLPYDVDGCESLVNILHDRDPEGPPSSVEYALEHGSGVRMYRLRRQKWSSKSVVAKKLWMDKKWRHEVLEKRKKTQGEKGTTGDVSSCRQDDIASATRSQDKLLQTGSLRARSCKIDTCWTTSSTDVIAPQKPRGKRDDDAMKLQKKMARRRIALERHRRLKQERPT